MGNPKPSDAALIEFSLNTIRNGSPGERYRASEELIKIGADATPYLIESLTDENNDIRETAAWALGRIRPVLPQVVTALEEALADNSPSVREKAIFALNAIDTAEARKALKRA